jgi:hypothetical protein
MHANLPEMRISDFTSAWARARRREIAPVIDLLLGFLHPSLDAGEVVEVVIYSRWRGQLGFLDELGGVPFSGTLCPSLVPLVAWQRTCACTATRAAVLGAGVVASGGQPVSDEGLRRWTMSLHVRLWVASHGGLTAGGRRQDVDTSRHVGTYQMLHKSLNSG